MQLPGRAGAGGAAAGTAARGAVAYSLRDHRLLLSLREKMSLEGMRIEDIDAPVIADMLYLIQSKAGYSLVDVTRQKLKLVRAWVQ